MSSNEPAFPAFAYNPMKLPIDGSGPQASPGMTIRDYFAAAALQGILAATTSENIEWMHSHGIEGQKLGQAMAEAAYAFADGMLAERGKA